MILVKTYAQREWKALQLNDNGTWNVNYPVRPDNLNTLPEATPTFPTSSVFIFDGKQYTMTYGRNVYD